MRQLTYTILEVHEMNKTGIALQIAREEAAVESVDIIDSEGRPVARAEFLDRELAGEYEYKSWRVRRYDAEHGIFIMWRFLLEKELELFIDLGHYGMRKLYVGEHSNIRTAGECPEWPEPPQGVPRIVWGA
jgi:hypothetical protein